MSPTPAPHSVSLINPSPSLSNSFSLLTAPPPPSSKNLNPNPDLPLSSVQIADPSPSTPQTADPPPIVAVPPPPPPVLSTSKPDPPPQPFSITDPHPPLHPYPSSGRDSAATTSDAPLQSILHRSGHPSDPLHHLQRPASSSDPKGSAPPPQQLSYAQAARSSRGPSFVRAHANAVESFAKIPRTGVNIISGSKEGIPSFSFVSSELSRVENLYSNALVMKFHGGRPSLESSHNEIRSWGIEHPFSIGPLTSRSFLLRFQNNTDLLKVLTRPSSMLITFPYKIFRWHNLCHLKEDSCLAPVWISLPRLPLQRFIPEFLEAVGNKIGRFLCFDKATTTLARPSAARICVELDLRKPHPQSIWVGLFDGFRQPIIYERMPKFCSKCHVLGHYATTCTKTCPDPLQPSSAAPAPIAPACPPAVRQNAAHHSPIIQNGGSNLSSLSRPIPPVHAPNQQQHPPKSSNTEIPAIQPDNHQTGAKIPHNSIPPSKAFSHASYSPRRGPNRPGLSSFNNSAQAFHPITPQQGETET